MADPVDNLSPATAADEPKGLAPDAAPPHAASSSQRLLSLDAMRGFTMFWIVGGRELALDAAAFFYPPVSYEVRTQLTHARWAGFVAWDMIMPVFLFVVGAALPFAMASRSQQGQPLRTTYWRIIRRVILLWGLGMIVQWIAYEPENIELYSNTLQAIAVGYLVTSIALLHLPVFGQIILCAALVLGYWVLLVFVPFGGHEAGTLLPKANFAYYVDVLVLGHFRRQRAFTWVVTSLGFAATVLLGAMAGHLLRSRMSADRKLLWLLGVGGVLMAVGWEWSYWLPLNRHLWTSSMIVWAGGCSFVFLAVLYAVIDLAGIKWWAFPFLVIGANALLAYILDPILDAWYEILVLVLRERYPTVSVEPLASVVQFTILWLILWSLYRRRKFVRV
jgi:predicted acyltransferase